jgi:hypothetical protein
MVTSSQNVLPKHLRRVFLSTEALRRTVAETVIDSKMVSRYLFFFHDSFVRRWFNGSKVSCFVKWFHQFFYCLSQPKFNDSLVIRRSSKIPGRPRRRRCNIGNQVQEANSQNAIFVTIEAAASLSYTPMGSKPIMMKRHSWLMSTERNEDIGHIFYLKVYSRNTTRLIF